VFSLIQSPFILDSQSYNSWHRSIIVNSGTSLMHLSWQWIVLFQWVDTQSNIFGFCVALECCVLETH
jgi:hypothetical protein